MMQCAGCAREFVNDEPCYEVERYHYYCTFCCVPTWAGEVMPEPDQLTLALSEQRVLADHR